MVGHLCGVPMVSGLLRVRIQDVSMSSFSFHIQLSQVSEVLGFSSLIAHLNVSSSCSGELLESPEEHTLSSFDEVESQRVHEIILDSTFCSQRFSVKKSFVHFCIRQICSSVLDLGFLLQAR